MRPELQGEREQAEPEAPQGIGLAEWADQNLITKGDLAHVFDVTERTIQRMVDRGELPPPVVLGKRVRWILARVKAHIEERAERAAKKAAKRTDKIGGMT